MRISFQIKCIVLCVTLLCLSHGRIHFYSSGFEKHLSKKIKQFGKYDRLYGEDEDDDIVQRRKHKPKGRPVAEAEITELNIPRSYNYCEFNADLINTSFCTRSQKAHCKRGPPAPGFFS